MNQVTLATQATQVWREVDRAKRGALVKLRKRVKSIGSRAGIDDAFILTEIRFINYRTAVYEFAPA
jgi:hypothetical protein